jgi:uncharacterized protein YecT (DUF1311 family)
MRKTSTAFSIALALWLRPVCAADPSGDLDGDAERTFTDRRTQEAFDAGDDQFCAREARDESELSTCLSAQADHEEKKLNDTYRLVLASLPEDRQKRLRAQERKWIKMREAECAKQMKDVELCRDGCGVPWTMRLVCMVKEARNRTRQLQTDWQ